MFSFALLNDVGLKEWIQGGGLVLAVGILYRLFLRITANNRTDMNKILANSREDMANERQAARDDLKTAWEQFSGHITAERKQCQDDHERMMVTLIDNHRQQTEQHHQQMRMMEKILEK
jgi:hypothetical protein